MTVSFRRACIDVPVTFRELSRKSERAQKCDELLPLAVIASHRPFAMQDPRISKCLARFIMNKE